MGLGTRASAKRLGCKTTVCKHRNCLPMSIFGKRMAAGFRKQGQPWRVGTAQELWVWWTINESSMSMWRRMLWPHNRSSLATEGHELTTHSRGHESDPVWKKADLSQIQLLFMCESHKNIDSYTFTVYIHKCCHID